MYAANGEFSSNACIKLMTHTIKNPQHGNKSVNGAETEKQITNGRN